MDLIKNFKRREKNGANGVKDTSSIRYIDIEKATTGIHFFYS